MNKSWRETDTDSEAPQRSKITAPMTHALRPFRQNFGQVIRTKMRMMTTITRAVLPSGDLVMAADQIAQVLEESVVPPTSTTTLKLNRPAALHALSWEMCSALYNRLRHIEKSTNIKCVILRSQGTPGRAFCAGGDVRAFHYDGEDIDSKQMETDSFFRTEYKLDSFLGSMKRASIVSILDGIVMGGGVGLSVHGRWRVATENTVFAMPECIIGLHPDIGASFVLSRIATPGLGAFLALTGGRLKGQQVVDAGIATHFVHSSALKGLISDLANSDMPNISTISDILDIHQTQTQPADCEDIAGLSVMKSCFTRESLSEVISALEEVSRKDNNSDSEFASNALKMIKAGSPFSVNVTWKALGEGKAAESLDECLKKDFRLIARLTRRSDFQVGVRSALITKDRNPIWKPAVLDAVSVDDISNMFKPLAEDLHIDELSLDHDNDSPSEVMRSRL